MKTRMILSILWISIQIGYGQDNGATGSFPDSLPASFTDDSLAAPDPAPASYTRPVLTVVGSGEGSAQSWGGSMGAEYVRFRLSAMPEIGILDTDQVRERTGESTDGSASGREEQARRAGATHVVEVSISQRGRGALEAALVVRDLGVNTASPACRASAAPERVWPALDSCVKHALQVIGVAPSKIGLRFLDIPVMGQARTAMEMEQIFARDKTMESATQTARDLEALAGRDKSAYLSVECAARRYARAGDFAKAARLAEALIDEIGPYHAGVYVLAARMYRVAQKPAEAYRIVKVAEQMDLSTPELVCEKAMTLEEMDDPDGAAEAYRRVVLVDQSNPRANEFLVRHLAENGQHDEAVAMAVRFTAVSPANVKVRLELARSLLALGRPEEAVLPLQEALSTEPTSPAAHILMGDAEAAQGKLAEAVTQYRSAIPRSPDEPSTHDEQGYSAEAYVKASRTLRAMGDYAEALAVVRPTESSHYDNPEVQKEIGLAAYGTGDDETAVRCLNRYASDGEPDTAVMVRLADLQRRGGDVKQALALYRQVQQYRPDDETVKRTIAELQGSVHASTSRQRTHRKVNLRVPVSVVAGVASAGTVAAGIYFNQRVKESLAGYNTAQNQDDVTAWRTEAERSVTYRNILYVIGGVAAAGCGVTIILPSRKKP